MEQLKIDTTNLSKEEKDELKILHNLIDEKSHKQRKFILEKQKCEEVLDEKIKKYITPFENHITELEEKIDNIFKEIEYLDNIRRKIINKGDINNDRT